MKANAAARLVTSLTARHHRFAKYLVLTMIAGSLLACSTGPVKPKPVELSANVALIGTRLAWTKRVGMVDFPLEAAVSNRSTGSTVTIASGDGVVASFEATTGREIWRTNIGAAIVAGVGGDDQLAAVFSAANEVVVLERGRVLWRQKLTVPSFTAPLVADGRVFVLGTDRSMTAFDAQTGRRLWAQKRSNDALALRQSGVLLSSNDAVVVGLSGRLVGLNPLDGNVRWEAPIATARGTNDVERLVDLVSPANKVGDVICARSFRVSVGCVNVESGTLLWTKPASGLAGVLADGKAVYGTEADGKIVAWNRNNGERLWSTERLQYRQLTAPALFGRALVVGESTGLVHVLSRDDGSPLTRLTTDGSAVVGAPVLAGNNLIVFTRSGGVFSFSPE